MSTTTNATTVRSQNETPDVDRVLMQLLAGAWVTQAIATAARLGLPDALASGPMTVDEIAAKAGTNRGATKRLMRMLTGIGVFAPADGGRYGLTAVSERLREETPGSLKHMFIAETDGLHWRSWEKVADAVRTGLPRPKPVFGVPAFEYYGEHKDEGEQFGRAMANVSGLASKFVLDAYDFGGLKTIMDVGGGNGSMVRTILEKYPQARGIIADLPYIADQLTLPGGAVDDAALEQLFTEFMKSDVELELHLGEHSVRVSRIRSSDVPRRFGFNPQPRPASGEPEC